MVKDICEGLIFALTLVALYFAMNFGCLLSDRCAATLGVL